jgi:hypothetical protein
MDETYTYPSFDYQAITYYKPPGYAGIIFYEGVLQRLFSRISLEPCKFTSLDPCWMWEGNRDKLISHKYSGMIPVRHLTLALFSPETLNLVRAQSRKRLRFQWVHRCGSIECIRPDHHLPTICKYVINWARKPIQRNPKKSRDEWLTFIEVEYMQAQLLMGSVKPSEWLLEYAERIALPYSIVGEVWLQLQAQFENKFKECSL